MICLFVDLRVGAERDPGAVTCVEQPFVEERRVQFTRAPNGHAAVIEIAANLTPLFRSRDDLGIDLNDAVEHLRFFLHFFEMRRGKGADEASPALEMALDAFTFDQRVDVLINGEALVQ